MLSQSSMRIVALSSIVLILFSAVSTVSVNASDTENPCSGSYVDKVVYRVISNPDARILSLLAGDVDAILDPIDPVHLDTLEEAPETDVHEATSTGYSYISINCRDYPLNISGLRRAFAYAFDKTEYVTDFMENHAFVHDSIMPEENRWCVEEDLPWHYYTNQSDVGNEILDALNFTIDGGSGYRLAPNGDSFRIEIEYPWTSGNGGMERIAQAAAESLASLHIDTRMYEGTVPEIYQRVWDHGEYDMMIFSAYGATIDLNWILDNYYSENAVVTHLNPANYVNDTFDGLRGDVLTARTYEEFIEAISSLQTNLHENVPTLVICHRVDYQAYRTEVFTGHVDDVRWGVNGPWTNMKVHNKSGSPFGGVYDMAISIGPNTLNPFIAANNIDSTIISNLYSSLCRLGPDNVVYPDLVEDVVIETHSTNSAVLEGQLWLTVEIKHDATWSDGTELTAEDVAFTFMYINESLAFGNPAGTVPWVGNYLSSEVLSAYKARMKLSSESYYDIQEMLMTTIIPEHILNEDTGLGYSGWNNWNLGDPHVSSGPFYVSEISSSTVELSRYMEYYWPSGLAPKILSVENVTYVQGSSGNQIEWEVTDEDPLDYTIYQNGNLVETGDWNGSSIVHNVDGLSVGAYNYTLLLTDTSGHRVRNIVWVTVLSGTSDILVIGITVAAAVLVVGLLIWRRR